MITTVTLNAAIDKTYYMPSFETGKVMRVPEMVAFPGGKGINVARVAHLLGERVLATGFVAGKNGEFIEQELGKQGIAHDFVRVDGESRLCLNILDASTGSSTELLEAGPVITPQQVESMKLKIGQLARQSELVTFSGSAAKGTPTGIYAELTAIAKSEGAKVFLDTSGDALAEGIEAIPYFIKPNEDEVERLIGKRLERESDLYDSIAALMKKGIRCVAVSLGANGAVVGCGGELYRVSAPSIQAVNTVGCGDAFVAGMAAAVRRNAEIADALKLASAAGTANALMPEAGNVRPADVERLRAQVEIKRIAQ